MKNLILITFIIFGFSLFSTNALKMRERKAFVPKNITGDFDKEWKSVDSLINIGLPKSALEIVETIYVKAKDKDNSDQILKSYIYRLKLKNSIEDYAFETLLYELKADSKTAKFPANAMMHSMLAEMYMMYYDANSYKFLERTNTINFDNSDIQTWTLDQLTNEVIKENILSLTETQLLQQTAVDKYYTEVITWGNQNKELRPTLYDFLAHRAIDYFSRAEITLTRPADYFELKTEDFFGSTKDFINIKIKSNDTLSLHYNGFLILQNLLAFRSSKTAEIPAMIDVELKRLEFVYLYSVNSDKENLYLKSLQNLETQYINNSYVAEVSYKIAEFYNNKSVYYNPNDETTFKYKTYKKLAFDICQKIIDSKVEWTIDKAKYLQSIITTHVLSFQTDNVIGSFDKFAVNVSYTNINKIYYKVATIDRSEYKNLTKKYWNQELYDKLLNASTELYKSSIDIKGEIDYNNHSSEVLLNGLPYGFYIVIFSNNENFSYQNNITSYDFITVSDLSYIKQEEEDGSFNVTVLNRKTGKPVSNVKVRAYYEKWNSLQRSYVQADLDNYTTDIDGFIKVPSNPKDDSKSVYLEFVNDKDYLLSDDYFWLYYSKYENYDTYSISFFTDRAIYRPGQTVFYKGIMLKKNGVNNEIVSNTKVSLTFYDPNWQSQSTNEATTNDYGSFSGNFVIPTTSLNGSYQIYTAYGSAYIRVEEYKRPTFEVEMLPFDGNYILNDSVTVKGTAKNYAGSNLTDANVKFRIQRLPIWRGWWYRYMPYNTIEIENGEVLTNDKGEFELKFKAIPDLAYEKNEFQAFNYTINVDVTDLNGETQSTSSSIIIGYSCLTLDISLSAQINKAKAKDDDYNYTIYTQNLNYENLKAAGAIKIYKLIGNSEPLRNRIWAIPDNYLYTQDEWKTQFPGNIYKAEDQFKNYTLGEQVFDSKFNTADTNIIDLSKMKKWESGVYVAKLSAKDAYGTLVNYEENFTLYSEKDKTIPYNTIDWFTEVKTFCEPGETAQFLIGSGLEDVTVLYEIERQYKITKKEWITLNKEQKLIEIPVKEEDRGNFTVHFVFVKNNRIYNHSSIVYVPRTDKQLDIEFQTFRDKLLPGAEEKWSLTIKGRNGEKVMAEMLMTMYDESLDKFAVNNWYFNIYSSYYDNMPWTSNTFTYGYSQSLKIDLDPYVYFPYRYYDALNWFGFSYYSRGYYDYGYYYEDDEYDGFKENSRKMLKSLAVGSVADKKDEVYMEAPMEEKESNLVDDISPVAPVVTADELTVNQSVVGGDLDGKDEVQIRTNFNESAFFFPHLETNENGEVVVSFTVPESLTRWKIMGFAHTKDLKYGSIENHLVTQKELMVIPNAPRFFREGDKMDFPVKISNISNKELKGEITLEFFDAITLEPINNIFVKENKKSQEFKVGAGMNSLVTWELQIPEGLGLITYKVVAKAGNLSDGEQKPLPVLTNRMLVTESLPLWVRGNSEKSFTFTKLVNSGKSSTLTNFKLTLEFTSNPAWYAVQSLPYLMEYPYECAEQTFSRFYANSLASHVANSSPKIKAVFDSWKNTQGSEALLSNLEKNEELKSLLLQETPWVLESQDETERKKRVGLLFDLNKMATELDAAMKKLQKEQAPNGGWSWFVGMPESRYITQHIVTGMGHLDKLGVENVRQDNKVWQMVTKAIDYLDDDIIEDYKWLKKYYTAEQLKENHLSTLAIHYLYGRSFFTDVDIPAKAKEAVEYYKGQMATYWLSQSIYEQGMIALALSRYENKTVPMMIVKSLKEFATVDEELGMYWKNNVSGYYWYEAPIETQALMIEVFSEVAKDTEAIDNTKIWLLKNKQTNDWKTTKATCEAVYALLLQGTEWLADSKICEITLGNQVIDPKKIDGVDVEAGTGYFKTSWSKTEIKPEMGNVTIKNSNNVIAWGALYWQYFEDLDKITSAETPLKLKKQLFKEIITDKGAVIEPIIETSKLSVGDKIIVRIELRVDRDMDYVHMKDMRAAGFEPINVISSYKWQDGLGYYESTKDASTNFFFGSLTKGTFVFEYPLRVTHDGDFSNGITTIQCMYAPEFTSHSEGVRVEVKE